MVEKLEIYAKENRIPIMNKEGIDFLMCFIKKNNIKTILEIGSAIGYSAIKMALVNDDIRITTIEKDIERYNEAIKNIAAFSLNDRISVINEDALNVAFEDKFDLIFIDASKGKYIDFFEHFKDNLNDDGYIITDNIGFHGLVENKELIHSKNTRKLVEKIDKYIDFLKNNKEYKTEFIELGDHIAITSKE